MHIYKVFRLGDPTDCYGPYNRDRKGNNIYGCPHSCIVRAKSPKHAERLARIYMDNWRFANLYVERLDNPEEDEVILSCYWPDRP